MYKKQMASFDRASLERDLMSSTEPKDHSEIDSLVDRNQCNKLSSRLILNCPIYFLIVFRVNLSFYLFIYSLFIYLLVYLFIYLFVCC